MPYKDADSFLDHLVTDPALGAEFTSADSEATILAILEREQVECTPAQIRDAFLERYGSELDEEQLAAIAGGVSAAGIGAAVGLSAGIAVGTAVGVGAAAAAAA